jgi:hypothetical protein
MCPAIGVDESKYVANSGGDTGVASRTGARPRFMHQSYSRMSGDNVLRQTGGAVVHHDDLEQIARKALRFEAGQAGGQRAGLIKMWNDYRNHVD